MEVGSVGPSEVLHRYLLICQKLPWGLGDAIRCGLGLWKPPPLPHQMVRIMDRTWRWNPPPPSYLPKWIKPPKNLKKAAARRACCP